MSQFLNAQPVSNSVRNANQAAILKRRQWRKDYGTITRMIRNVKSEVRASNHPRDEKRILLDALRTQANFMMMDRDLIKMQLRETAYTYV